MDAMSDAIEGAAVMLYGVSLRYKESANVCVALHCAFDFSKAPVLQLDCLILFVCSACKCRLEANYAFQSELDMIPLMMQKDYSPKGWCKCSPSLSLSRVFILSAST